jgi:hypothetical protein
MADRNHKQKLRQLQSREALMAKHGLLPDLARFARDEAGRFAFLAYAEAMGVVLEKLDQALNLEQVRQSVTAVYKVVAEHQAPLERQLVVLPNGDRAKIACKAGCGWCCGPRRRYAGRDIYVGSSYPNSLVRIRQN